MSIFVTFIEISLDILFSRAKILSDTGRILWQGMCANPVHPFGMRRTGVSAGENLFYKKPAKPIIFSLCASYRRRRIPCLGQKKNNEPAEQVLQGNRKTTNVEPLHPQVEITDKNYNNFAIGGSFEIESKPGAGCKAAMIAPIKNTKTDKEIDHAYENFIS